LWLLGKQATQIYAIKYRMRIEKRMPECCRERFLGFFVGSENFIKKQK